jgi:hypothetical protein
MAVAASCVRGFETVDDATIDLIVSLQLADIDTLQSHWTGNGRERELTDAQLALELLQQNLEEVSSIISDRRMTASIATAVLSDGSLVAATANEEQIACEDHALAHQLNGSNVVSEVNLQPQKLDDNVLAKLAGIYISEKSGLDFTRQYEEDDNFGEGPSASQHRGQEWQALNRHCEACREPMKYFDLIATPCKHEYCRDCLRELFESCLTDESLFPPRCCRQPITIDSVEFFLTADLKRQFEQKKVEFSTPNRTYCSQPSCAAFIRIDEENADAGTCTECGTRTCSICKSAAHAGECPQDMALQALVELANEQGWQRCHVCRRVVELDMGCNHIT